MSRIHVRFITNEGLETLRANAGAVSQEMLKHPDNADWLEESLGVTLFSEMPWTIEDFTLAVPKGKKDKATEFANAITLYEALRDLPAFVLSDERFWMWINFEKGYEAALKAAPVKKDGKALRERWLFSQRGIRPSLLRGPLSGRYFRVAMTVELAKDDPYELTRFAIESPTRISELLDRNYSNNRTILHGILRAEVHAVNEYGQDARKPCSVLSKQISKMASLKILDAMPEEFIEQQAFSFLESEIKKAQRPKKAKGPKKTKKRSKGK